MVTGEHNENGGRAGRACHWCSDVVFYAWVWLSLRNDRDTHATDHTRSILASNGSRGSYAVRKSALVLSHCRQGSKPPGVSPTRSAQELEKSRRASE